MKKNSKRTRLQSLDAAQLAQVSGGRNAMLDLANQWTSGSGYYEFFYGVYEGSGGCGCTQGYSSTPVP
jgi:hypothetical protein